VLIFDSQQFKTRGQSVNTARFLSVNSGLFGTIPRAQLVCLAKLRPRILACALGIYFTISCTNCSTSSILSKTHGPVDSSGNVGSATLSQEARLMLLEDSFRNFETETVERRAWEQEQNTKSTNALHSQRGFADVLARVRAYRHAPQPPRLVELRGAATFSLERKGDTNVMAIVRRIGKEAVSLFQTSTGGEASRTRIDLMTVSPSGKYVAVGTSEAGTEETSVRIIDTQSGREFPERLFDVRTGALDWLPDDTGILYMRGRGRKSVPIPDQSRDFSVALHVLGTGSDKDIEIVGSRAKGERIHGAFEYCYPSISPDGKYIIISVRRGVNPDLSIYVKRREDVLNSAIKWQNVFSDTDRVKTTSLGVDRLIVVRSVDQHTNVVEEVGLLQTDQRRIIYSTSRPIDRVLAAGAATYVVELNLGTKHLLAIRGAERPVNIALPGNRSVWSEGVRFDPISRQLAVDLRSWVEQASWWTLEGDANAVERMAEVNPSPTQSEDFEVVVVEAQARDGELIPVTVVRRKGTSSQTHVWATAYGAYGAVSGPSFTVARRTFLELGGTYVFAHVRGGGEKGRPWHDAGRGVNKRKTVDDFVDALKFLRRQGFGGNGGGIMVYGSSAGALPVGGVLVREPELVNAVAIESGLVNVSRLDEGNSTGVLHADEIGTNKTADGAQRLRDLDVYRNVRSGVSYPPVLVSAGINDARVPHWQSDKLAAKLKSVGTSVFFRLTGGGHSGGNTSDEESDADAELVSFALANTGHPGFR
jgi:prolyl oligopeptidase